MNKKLVSLVTMTSIIITSASPMFAKNFTSKQNVALDHAWTVKFNKTLASNQDFSKVTIKDSKGTVVPIDATINSDKQSVNVAPKENYSANTNYTLTVDGIKDTTGKNLKENATLSFTTVAPSTPSSIIQPEFIQGAENRADRVWNSYYISTSDGNGGTIPINSYLQGLKYTKEQASKFRYNFGQNPDYDHMDVICGLGSQIEFKDGKVYCEKGYPINVIGATDTDHYGVGEMVRYTNPINPLAEKQIYTLVSNVAKTDDSNGNKYALLYNGGYDDYTPDANGNLVPIGTKYHESTNFFLTLASQKAGSDGYLDEYGKVEFLESPHTVNDTSYNLKLAIIPSIHPTEVKLLLDSVVGSKFGDDYSKEIDRRYSEALHSKNPADIINGEFIVDGIKCLNDFDGMFISY